MGSNDSKDLAELDKSFNLLAGNTKAGLEYEQLKLKDDVWKRTDPEGYKKDMEDMCKSMFGDTWEIEYAAMLREELPEEFEE
jgi:hypothetical protein